MVLLDLVAGRLQAAERRSLERHVAGCEPCQAFCRAQTEVWDLLDEVEAPAPSWGFDRRVEEAARQLGWRARLGSWLGWRPLLPAAAALAVWAIVAPMSAPERKSPEPPANAEVMERALEDLDMLQTLPLHG